MGQKDLAVIILAAGKGTRMQSETPKVMHKIGGKPMIQHVLEAAITLNPTKIITVLRRGMEQVQQQVEHASEVVLQEQQLGTGDAVKAALPHLKNFKGHVLILYGDTPLITRYTLQEMLSLLHQDTALVVLGFTPQDAAQYGRLVVSGKQTLERIVEYKEADQRERDIGLCNAGVMAIKASLLHRFIEQIDNRNQKGEYYLTDLIKIARDLEHDCAFLEADPGEVMGVNSRLELSVVEGAYQTRLREALMRQGVTLIAPETVFLSHDLKVGRDITIHPHVVLGEKVVLEDEVEILSFSHIVGANIGRASRIGPFARLRPFTEIGRNVSIGNFVEIKQTDIEHGSKINHLSYVGDSVIGRDVNIGAGTVTCNYDGYNKHTTHIADEAFIGSNVALVSPVKIGQRAIVGAGSTITQNVEQDAMGLTRSEQQNLNDAALRYHAKHEKSKTDS